MKINRFLILIMIIAVAFPVAFSWHRGDSVFRFESLYWDLGLLPILAALLIGVGCFYRSDGRRKRFFLGFEVCGWLAVIAYIVSCSRPARWSMVSVLLPYQTGFMLAPEMRTSWRDLSPWGIIVDTVILVSLPFLAALTGGVMASARFSLRRVMIGIAIIGVVLGAAVDAMRKGRQLDRLGSYHRNRIVGLFYGHGGPDGKMVIVPSAFDRQGNLLSPRQRRLDRWHEAMAQKYWHSNSAYRPWETIGLDPPEPE